MVTAVPHQMREGASPRSAIAVHRRMLVRPVVARAVIRGAVAASRAQDVDVDVDVAAVAVAAGRAISREEARAANAAGIVPWRR